MYASCLFFDMGILVFEIFQRRFWFFIRKSTQKIRKYLWWWIKLKCLRGKSITSLKKWIILAEKKEIFCLIFKAIDFPNILVGFVGNWCRFSFIIACWLCIIINNNCGIWWVFAFEYFDRNASIEITHDKIDSKLHFIGSDLRSIHPFTIKFNCWIRFANRCNRFCSVIFSLCL